MALVRVTLLASHLLAMNVATAGPLVCLWLRFRGRRGDVAADGVGWRLAAWSLWGLFVGIAFGSILVGMAWADADQSYWDAARRFEPHTFVFALAELAFTAACLAAYLATWNRWGGRPWLHGLFAVLAATNLMYHFPPLMIVLGQLSARPELTDAAIITRSVYRQLMLRPEVIANVLHFALASAAVTGLLLMHLASRQLGRVGIAHQPLSTLETGGPCPPYDGKLVSSGAWIALVSSISQLAVGLWVLMQLPLSARNSLVGDDWLASGLFVLSIGAALGAMHTLSSVAMGETSQAAVWRSTVLILAVVILMAGTLLRSRWVEAGGRSNLVGWALPTNLQTLPNNGGQCPPYKT